MAATLATAAVASVALALPDAGRGGQAAMLVFHSPSGNIVCDLSRRGAYCEAYRPVLSSVLLRSNGQLAICHSTRCIANGHPFGFKLGYGTAVVAGSFRCTSLRIGMRCAVRATGKGFLISRSGVRRIGA